MNPNSTTDTYDLSSIAIPLLKGVLYQEHDAALWQTLLSLQTRLRDYFAVLGLELVLDEAEAYAFLRAKAPEEDDVDKLPRLIARRPLAFPVSLLLALLRKKLAEFDAAGGDTRLVLSRDDIAELLRVFVPESSNQVRLLDQIDSYINKIIELGFLYRLPVAAKQTPSYEVRRILKAFVDGQWLADFDARLSAYRAHLTGENND
jgi:hypothetical protein